jgi:hypothetical protein
MLDLLRLEELHDVVGELHDIPGDLP